MSRADLGDDARRAAVLLAIDPRGLKGAVLLASASEDAEAFAATLRSLLSDDAPWRRVPGNVSDERLVGGLDFSATLSAGRVVAERGVLAAADGGVVAFDAVRARPTTWVHVNRALDDGEIRVERDGIAARHPSRFVAIVTDDPAEPRAEPSFRDRAAFIVHLREPGGEASAPPAPAWCDPSRSDIDAARARLADVMCPPAVLDAIVRGADRLGVVSARIVVRALACARAHAALRGSPEVEVADVECAARLVLAPRALPAVPAERESPDVPQAPDTRSGQSDREPSGDAVVTSEDDGLSSESVGEMADVVVRAATIVLEQGLLTAAVVRASRDSSAQGGAGERRVDGVRGRQIGTRRGDPRSGARLDLVATLRAAAPFQRLRRTARIGDAVVIVRRDDLRVRRCVTPARSTTLFVVDASGSSALARLNEAKGAVELLLTEGYARRERVGLIAFRGTSADLVLAPTHALARARRAVAGLPGGGGTPLAAGLELAATIADSVARDGTQLSVVLLTDACANVARDGTGGRARAEADALAAARRLASCGCRIVMIDTSRRPAPFARPLHAALGGRYLRLPSASAASVAGALRVSHD